MRVSDKAIVLQSVKHGDRKYILKIYTSHHGLLTVVASAGRSPSSKVRTGSILPLTLVDVEFVLRQNREIHVLTEASCYYVCDHIPMSLAKLAIAQFINEILIKSLKEQNANHHLFEFVETCLKYLNDSSDDFVNLHLYFLIEFSRYIGFEPQNNYSSAAPFFDCREGKFNSYHLSFPLGLDRDESLFFSEKLRQNLLHSQLTNAERQALLEILVGYYKVHVPGFNDMRSIAVLKELMAG